MKSALRSTFLTAAAFSPCAHAAMVVGGFDTDRVGEANIAGPYFEEMRAAVSEAYPGATFVVGETLDAAFLSRVDILVIGAPTISAPVTLSSAEQTSLLNFIRSGQGAIIYVDNESYAGVPASDLANESFLDPFGIDSTGYIDSPTTLKPGATPHPVMDGRFGKAEAARTYYPGWFDHAGPHAVVLAQHEENAQPAVLAIPEDALGPGSGRVVFLSDANMLGDAEIGYFGLPGNRAMMLNAVEYVSTVPEPSTAAMLTLSAALLAMRRRRAR